MRSFDERGGGRRVAANLADDAFGSFEDDKHDADDLGGDTHDWGGNDTQKQAAPTNEAAVNKQQANRGGDADFDEEPPKVLLSARHATRTHLVCMEACAVPFDVLPFCDACPYPVCLSVPAWQLELTTRLRVPTEIQVERNTRGDTAHGKRLALTSCSTWYRPPGAKSLFSCRQH